MGEILILRASPRRDGNCAFLARRAARVFEKRGAPHVEVDAAALDLGMCSACDLCREKKAKYCAIKDDMSGLYERIVQAPSILFVSPIYWFTYSAQLKVVIDRLYGLWNWDNECLRGKRVGAAFVYGDVDPYASGAVNAMSTFDHMLRFTRAQNCGFAYGTANDPGDAEKNADLVGAVEALAARLA